MKKNLIDKSNLVLTKNEENKKNENQKSVASDINNNLLKYTETDDNTIDILTDKALDNEIPDINDDKNKKIRVFMTEYLKGKEKIAIRNFYENTCSGRVIFLNELNYNGRIGTSVLTKIAGEAAKIAASKLLPSSMPAVGVFSFPAFVLGGAIGFGISSSTTIATNKMTKHYDKLQPQLGDSVLPSTEDNIIEAVENSIPFINP